MTMLTASFAATAPFSQAITLVESNPTDHADLAQEVVGAASPGQVQGRQIGITGVPEAKAHS